VNNLQIEGFDMIDLVTSRDLLRLAATTSDHCVSIFLPTHRAGPDQVQDPIRLKNLLTRAATELTALGVGPAAADELLDPATQLLRDQRFWAHQDDGLALYLTHDTTEAYRLAEPTEELVVITDRFHLKPLIPAVATGTTFHVLALSQNRVRLLRGNATHLAEIGLGDIPPSLAQVVRFDDRERQLHSHGADRVGRGTITATFHGHGGAKDTAESDLRRFLKAVDDGLADLAPKPPPPLVLAGVDHIVAAYRNTTSRPRIIDTAIEGSPDHLDTEDVHTRAWALVRPVLDQARTNATEDFLAGSQPTAATTLEVLRAASTGRVDTLFTPSDSHRWGTFDAEHETITEHDSRQPGDHDLYDLAAIETLTHHGTVYAIPIADIPGDGPVAAILRY
jgi:hypothetical protein